MKHLSDQQIQEIAARTSEPNSSNRSTEAERHLRNCYDCHERVDEYKELLSTLASCPQAELRPSFTRNVMRKIALEESPDIGFQYVPVSVLAITVVLIGLLGLVDFEWLFSRGMLQFLYFCQSVNGFLVSLTVPDISLVSDLMTAVGQLAASHRELTILAAAIWMVCIFGSLSDSLFYDADCEKA